MSIGHELLNVPMGDMIRDMAFAIADAQIALDENSIDVAEMMGGLRAIHDDEGNVSFDDSRVFFGYEYLTGAEAKDRLIAAGAETTGQGTATELVKDANKAFKAGTDPADPEMLTLLLQSVDGDTVPEELVRIPTRVSMLELGFAPTFYQFVDTIIEVKIAIKINRTREYSRTTSRTAGSNTSSTRRSGGGILGAIFGGKRSRGVNTTATTSQVDATYASKYSYSAEGASLLRTKLVPIPVPGILEERIRDIMEYEREVRDTKLAPPEVVQ